jgi:hypothetical protein
VVKKFKEGFKDGTERPKEGRQVGLASGHMGADSLAQAEGLEGDSV